MPCEPVASGVPPTPSRPSSPSSSSMHPTTSTSRGLASYRMKQPRSGVGGGARRALTALGTNDTSLNVRLAKSLLTISQDKFAKKWNFDPVREMPLGQTGRFQWTPTGTLGLGSESSCHSSGSSGLSLLFSHDLGATAVGEAEEKAAALRRTCLNLPQAPDLPSYTTITDNAPPPPPDTLTSHEPRVPPPHPEDPLPTLEPTPTQSETTTDGPNSSSSSSSSRSAVTPSSESRRKVTGGTINMQGGTELILPRTTSAEPSSRVTTVGIASDASSRVVIDKEPLPTLQDNNQCQTSIIDPTDTSHQHSTVRTQACITNYLRPRKRSSAHLQEAVHPSKTKKGSCRGIV